MGDFRYAIPSRPNSRRHLLFYRVDFPVAVVLCEPDNVDLLRTAFRTVKSVHPFTIGAFVLLPEHLHCIWTLPPGYKNYPMLSNVIKNYFTRHCQDTYKSPTSPSQQRKRMQTVWQPRYWEHPIRGRVDLVCAFDSACDAIRSNFIELLDGYDVIEVTEHRPVQVKTLVARAA